MPPAAWSRHACLHMRASCELTMVWVLRLYDYAFFRRRCIGVYMNLEIEFREQTGDDQTQFPIYRIHNPIALVIKQFHSIF